MSTIIQVSVVDGSQNKKTTARSNFMLPAHWDLTLSDNALMSVYCFIKNFIGASGGTSTVAIDNKIEQAMDLVKSHLMFAVREEVDVLKEKITELMDRISQLEYENGFLRANASQETLNQLTQAQQLQQQQQQQQPQTTTITATPLQQQQQLQQQPQIVNMSQQQNIQKQQPAS